MNNPIKSLTRREWCLWLASLAVVLIANQITPELDPLTMTAALVGVTSLVFAAKGNVWSQVLMIVFSILYGVISFRFHYWGEMITYLGMTLPMAVWSTVTWLKNPSKENGSEVAIQTLARRHLAALAASTVAVAAVFYYILKLLDTPTLFFSTVSIITSFLAAALIWALIAGLQGAGFQMGLYGLLCVAVAGLYGAATVSGRILVVQTVPATAALIALLAGW